MAMTQLDYALLVVAFVALGVAVLMIPVSLLGITSTTAIRAFGLSNIGAWLDRHPEV